MDSRSQIKQERIKRNLSLKNVAQAINIAKSTVYGIESGRRNPSLRVAKKLAELFGKSIDELFPNTDDTKP